MLPECPEMHEISVEIKGGHLVAHLLRGTRRCTSDGCSKCNQQSLDVCRKGPDVFVDGGYPLGWLWLA